MTTLVKCPARPLSAVGLAVGVGIADLCDSAKRRALGERVIPRRSELDRVLALPGEHPFEPQLRQRGEVAAGGNASRSPPAERGPWRFGSAPIARALP